MEAWVWSAGADESSHARPPALTFADVCAPSGPAPGASAAGAATGGGAAGASTAAGQAGRGAGSDGGGTGWVSLAGGGAAMLAALGLVALARRRRRGA